MLKRNSIFMEMYFVALVLPDNLNDEIQVLKVMMEDKFGCKVGLKSPAHITLVPPFRMAQNKEAELVKDVDNAAGFMKPFLLRTQNFSSFKNRTIFIDVAHHYQLDVLKQKTDELFTGNEKYNVRKENRAFHPHITIATRDIAKHLFHEAWSFFEHKQYEVEWLAANLSLLHHNSKTWDIIYTAPFKKEAEHNPS